MSVNCWTVRSAARYVCCRGIAMAASLLVLTILLLLADGVVARPAPVAATTMPAALDGFPAVAITDLLGTTDLLHGSPTDSSDFTVAAPADTVLLERARVVVPDFFDTGVNGTAAVLMTPVFPGWGQLYAQNSWRAMLAFGAQWYFWSNMLARDRQAVRYRNHARTLPGDEPRAFYDTLTAEYWEQMRDLAWWSGAILLIVALDAYVGAGLYGFEEEPLPVPGRFEEFFDRDKPQPVGSRGAPLVVIWQWSKRF